MHSKKLKMSNITIDDETLVLWNLSNRFKKKTFHSWSDISYIILLNRNLKNKFYFNQKTQLLLWKFYRSLEEKEMSPDLSNNMLCNFFT